MCNLASFEKVTRERRQQKFYKLRRRQARQRHSEFLKDNFTRKGKYSTSSYLWWNAKLPRHFSECLYADDTKLVGEGNTLNSEPLVVTKTAECIDACINTWGCNYWTVEKSDNDKPVKCTLKSWKGRQVQEPGFISGSLPSNCCELMNYFAKFWVWVWDFALVFMQSRLVLKLIKISGMTTKNWLILIFCEAAINSINHGYCCLPKYLIFSENFSFFLHIVPNLHFLSKKSTLISRDKLSRGKNR